LCAKLLSRKSGGIDHERYAGINAFDVTPFQGLSVFHFFPGRRPGLAPHLSPRRLAAVRLGLSAIDAGLVCCALSGLILPRLPSTGDRVMVNF